MITITPIGSCRISIPLRIAAQEYDLKRNLARIYGYCHSSAEAVQQVRFLFGDYIPSADVEPLIASSQSFKELLQTKHHMSDLYIIELSSAKQLTLDGQSVQMNYLTRHFPTFFADRANRLELWRLAQVGDQNAIDGFLAPFVALATIDQEEFLVLRKLRYQLTRADRLRQDIDFLLEALPEVLFVSHVNAVAADGYPIASREQYIDLVKTTVSDVGGQICDPTDVMDRVGQGAALEDSSTSLAHFTPAFSMLVFESWLNQAISPLVETLVGAKKSPRLIDALIIDLKYQIRNGDMDKAKSRIKSALVLLGPEPDLVAMNAYCLLASNDHEKAIKVLKMSLTQNPKDTGLLLLLFEALAGKGDAQEALEYFKRLRQLDCMVPPAPALQLAERLEADGQPRDALELYRSAYDQNPAAILALESIARLALIVNEPAEIEACADLLIASQIQLNPILCANILFRGASPQKCVAYLKTLGEQAPDGFIAVLESLESHGQENIIAKALAEQAITKNVALARKFLAKWTAALATDISADKKSEILSRIQLIAPKNDASQILGKGLRRDILLQVRKHIKAKDVAAVKAMQDLTALAEPPIIDVPIFLSRYYYKLGNNLKSLEYAQFAMDMAPEHSNPACMTMRSAFRLKAYLIADMAAKKILGMAESKALPAFQEAQNLMDRLPALCLRASRNEPDVFEAWELLEIAKRDTTLAEKRLKQLKRLEQKMGARVQEMLEQSNPDFLEFALKVAALASDIEIVQRSLGSYYVDRQKFSKALPFWERLTVLEPDDETALFQLERCYQYAAKLKPA